MNKKIGIRTRKKQYQEKYQRKFPYKWFQYCREPLENIQNWDKMLNDTSNTRWHLHHMDEIQGDVVISVDELKCRGEYYKLPANKLIFITESEHVSLHQTGKQLSAEHKNILRDANIGKQLSAEHKQKLSEASKGNKCWLFGRTGENHPASKKIEIDGVPYGSIEAAAAAFDEPRRILRKWLKTGRAKYI